MMPRDGKRTTIWRLGLAAAVMSIAGVAQAAEALPNLAPPGPPSSESPSDVLPSMRRLPPADATPAPPLYDHRTEAAAVPPDAVGRDLAQRLIESTWYARVDYFHWNERLDGADFVNEDGALVTLGYVRRSGPERFRAELFGSSVHYSGSAQYDDGTSEPLSSHTDYLGVRGEYDLLFEPDCWPNVSLFAGIGTRLWIRDLPDDYTVSGNLVTGYHETWWTIYPYLGIERRRVVSDTAEFYGSGRIGCTAVTFQHVSLNDVMLHPRPGLTGQIELGVRGPNLFLAAYFEAFAWAESPVVRDSFQPLSRMFTVGLKTGFCF